MLLESIDKIFVRWRAIQSFLQGDVNSNRNEVIVENQVFVLYWERFSLCSSVCRNKVTLLKISGIKHYSILPAKAYLCCLPSLLQYLVPSGCTNITNPARWLYCNSQDSSVVMVGLKVLTVLRIVTFALLVHFFQITFCLFEKNTNNVLPFQKKYGKLRNGIKGKWCRQNYCFEIFMSNTVNCLNALSCGSTRFRIV